jgi:hypothetical protein
MVAELRRAALSLLGELLFYMTTNAAEQEGVCSHGAGVWLGHWLAHRCGVWLGHWPAHRCSVWGIVSVRVWIGGGGLAGGNKRRLWQREVYAQDCCCVRDGSCAWEWAAQIGLVWPCDVTYV